MRFNISINQQKCLQYGLNQNQGALMDLFGQLAAWASERVIDGKMYWHISRNKVIEEIPLFYEKPDTVYRAFKFLKEQNLIEYIQQNRIDYVRLTLKGKAWNKVGTKSELLGNESDFGNESEQLGNESELDVSRNPNEKQPVNHVYSDSNPTDNIITITSNKREANALEFLTVNFPSRYEKFLMDYKTKIGNDFQRFSDDFNCKVVEEKKEWDQDVLFARLTRLANNWIARNTENENKQVLRLTATEQTNNLPYRKNIV